MARIAGISTTKDRRGNPTKITIDLKKHPQAVEALKGIGLMEKSQFEIDCERAVSLEEAKQHTIDFINRLPWKE